MQQGFGSRVSVFGKEEAFGAETHGGASSGSASSGEDGVEASREASLAVVVLAARRRRDALFGASLFADPAWDMLLELFVRDARGSPVHISNLCATASVPMTTALRWITTLSESGLIERRPTGSQRRVEIYLTSRGRALMIDHLGSTASAIEALSRS
jgi:DNA-binding MarR family transcriptional regulator